MECEGDTHMTADPTDDRADGPPGQTGLDTGRVSAAAREPDRTAEFLRVLAHELRNYVAPIKNAVHVLRLRGGSDPELALMLDTIERQASGIVNAVERIIDAECASRGDIALTPARVEKRGEAAHHAASSDVASAQRSETIEGGRLPADGVRQAPLRILIADDSAAVRDSLARLLEDMGHQVRGAQDGAEAVKLAQRWMPDFVLLDVHMPRLNGVMAARALRAQFPSTLMRLVMMSGITLDEETQAGAKAAGFDSCIDKVFALEGLEKLFQSVGEST